MLYIWVPDVFSEIFINAKNKKYINRLRGAEDGIPRIRCPVSLSLRPLSKFIG